MKSVIVGTAGHIDHGKTALVKALTGIDADRLKEEKSRGITIDIGFAHLEIPAPNGETLRLGFVDVPGHERFVRNMLAGVGGIDLVLFVIAADESIKPQTREHFDICRLLAVRYGITVITKSDLVEAETVQAVRAEIEEFTRGSFLEASPIIPVSALTGEGFDELKQAIVQIGAEIPARDSIALTRLPIDRVFTIKGYGTVVTGTLISGHIQAEQKVELFPEARRVRVRGVQVHGQTPEQALAGQRTAVNLAGMRTEEIKRGMMLAEPAIFRSVSTLDVELTLLPSAKPLKNRTRVHFHAYTMQTIAEVRLHGKKQLLPGEKAFARLRLFQSTLLVPSDRFIIRQFSPVTTIGGGEVLDALPLASKSPPEKIISFLQTMVQGSSAEILTARIERMAEAGLRLSEMQAEMNLPFKEATKLAASLSDDRTIIPGDEWIMISTSVFNQLMNKVLAAVNQFHNANSLHPGIGKEELRDQVNLGPSVFYAVVEKLREMKKLEIQGEQIRIPGRGVVMKDEEAESKKMIESAFATAGLKVPALKDVLAGLKVDKMRAQKIVTLLLRDKVLIKVADELVFHHTALEKLRKLLLSEKAKSSKMDIARFKDLTAISRKYAIPLLEYLDRERVTRRVGNERIIN